nr:MAG TPA: hypothetical protein [Caudoviricetes sp.]
MKITMYELLGLVKDGKAPKEIKYKNFVYGWIQKYKTYTRYDITGKDLYITTTNLNDEVEIIEEDKKIIRLEFEEGNIEDKLFLARYITHNRAKINELIDEVNKLKGEK